MDKEKNKGGRPRKEVDWKLFEELCEIQCTEREVCSVLDMNINTINLRIKERFGEEACFQNVFEQKREKGKKSLRRAQWHKAIDEKNTTMQIWLGKQILGQTDKSQIEQAEAVEIFVRYGDGKKEDGEANQED